MRGQYVIESENSDGDRAIITRVDIEGLRLGQDALATAKREADEIMEWVLSYCVRIYHDDGWDYKLHAWRVSGLPWNDAHRVRRTA